MIARDDVERRFAIFVALLLPWLMLLVTDWTVTPVGMVDGWIYRALGRDLVQANATMGEYYYAARPFVLVPRYLLTRVFLEGAAHAIYGLLCAHVLLFAVLDLLTSVARPSTRLPGVLLFGTCLFLLRSLGWGYIDGSIITWLMVGLAGLARWYRAANSGWSRRASALVAGGCFAAMLSTHPMTLPLLFTPLLLVVVLQRASKQPLWWRLWVELAVGGVGAVLLMGVTCRLLYGRFFYFMPIIEAALEISASSWKTPREGWLLDANWLVLITFAWLASALLLATARKRRVRLTTFERFAWLNLVVLMIVMLALEFFTSGYWLEYPWFASYFVPSALLAIAAMLGERAKGALPIAQSVGLLTIFVTGSALAWHLQLAAFKPLLADRFARRGPGVWFEGVPLASIQAAVALVALGVLLSWHWRTRRIRPRSLLLGSAVVALLLGAPINQVAPGDAIEADAAASVAAAIALVQDELRGRRPVYWFETEHPLGQVFMTISSAHLTYYSHLSRTYPRGARGMRANGDGSFAFFESGDPVVILDETAERFGAAQNSFAQLGIALVETRRVPLSIAGQTWALIFATVQPKQITLLPSELPSMLKGTASGTQERVSYRERGYLSFGPYVRLGPGKHRITFHLRLLDKADSDTLAWVDVGDFSAGHKTALRSAPILASNAGPTGELDTTLDFTVLDETFNAEFRVLALGNARLALRSIDVERPELAVKVPRLAVLTASRFLNSGETIKSADLKTSGLFADMRAEAQGTGRLSVKATITLGPRSPVFVELSPGDELTATVGATSRPLTRQTLLAATWYEADFETETPGTEVKVALSRQVEPSALASSVVLPSPVSFTAPAPLEAFSRGSGVTVAWKDAEKDGRLFIRAKGPCIRPIEDTLIADTGSYTFAPFTAVSGSEPALCRVSISLARAAKGTVDPAWGKGGDFEAHAGSSLTISSRP